MKRVLKKTLQYLQFQIILTYLTSLGGAGEGAGEGDGLSFFFSSLTAPSGSFLFFSTLYRNRTKYIS